MAHRKWKETKQQPSLSPGLAVHVCSLDSFHFLWAILCPQAVELDYVKHILFTFESPIVLSSHYWHKPFRNLRYELTLLIVYVLQRSTMEDMNCYSYPAHHPHSRPSLFHNVHSSDRGGQSVKAFIPKGERVSNEGDTRERREEGQQVV